MDPESGWTGLGHSKRETVASRGTAIFKASIKCQVSSLANHSISMFPRTLNASRKA